MNAIREIRTLIVEDGMRPPTTEEIMSAYEFSSNHHCIVDLQWTMPYSGLQTYRMCWDKDNLEDVIKAIKERVYYV